MRKFWTWLKSFFTSPKLKPPSIKPVQDEVPIEPDSYLTSMRKTAVALAREDLWWRETKGKNRSPEIDALNEEMGIALGSPYCKSGLWIRVMKRTCDIYGLKNPVRKDASSQSMLRLAPRKYLKAAGVLPKMGDVGILTNRIDTIHGHIYLVSENATDPERHKTIEYNTNFAGSRDGEGVYELERSTSGTTLQSFSAYVDWILWALDFNGVDPNAKVEVRS